MAIPLSIIGAAIAEWLGAQSGLGYFSKRMMSHSIYKHYLHRLCYFSAAAMIVVAIINVIEKKSNYLEKGDLIN